MKNLVSRLRQSIRWRLGRSVASPDLELGTDKSVEAFYNSRITGCEFLDDPDHYEYPRATWILEILNGSGSLLEIGCGNGGMTRLIAPKVNSVTALDVSQPSLEQLDELKLHNVTTVRGLIENFDSDRKFEWIVMSEVIEHLRKPYGAVASAFEWLAPNGKMLITTPNGHWESDEHLHEFSLKSFSTLLAETECESLKVSYLRDRENRRRWLTAVLMNGENPPAPDDFFDRKAIARQRLNK